VVLGGAGGDALTGGPGDNRLVGGPGNDTITGGPGVDELDGGVGDDALMSRDALADTNACGAGTDSVVGDTVDILAPGECESLDLLAPPVASPVISIAAAPAAPAPAPAKKVDPCAKLRNRAKALCIRRQKALARCAKLKGARKATCRRRQLALFRCSLLAPGKARAICVVKARRIR
jgi:hypothetical protein